MDAEVGQIANTATVLMTLADLDDLIVETDVDEAYANQIAVGQPAARRLSGETQTRTGTVRTVAGQVDAATGGLSVKVGFDTPVTAPLDLSVTTNIVVDQRDAALTVPRTVLVSENGGLAVLLARNGSARLQPVSVTGLELGRESAILNLEDYIFAGSARLSYGVVVLGRKLAEDLDLSVGQVLRLQSSNGVTVVLNLGGIFQTGTGMLDRSSAFVRLQQHRRVRPQADGRANL